MKGLPHLAGNVDIGHAQLIAHGVLLATVKEFVQQELTAVPAVANMPAAEQHAGAEMGDAVIII